MALDIAESLGAALAVRLVAGDAASLAAGAAKVPEGVALIDARKVVDRRVLYAAALKAVTEARYGQLHGRSVVQRVLYNLSPSRSQPTAAALAALDDETRQVALFALDKELLASLDVSAIFGATCEERDAAELDAPSPEKEAAAAALYQLTPTELELKPMWQLVCARVATRGV